MVGRLTAMRVYDLIFSGSRSVSDLIAVLVHKMHMSLCGELLMKRIVVDTRKKSMLTIIAVGEGVWNGIVVSGVLAVSAMLINWAWPL